METKKKFNLDILTMYLAMRGFYDFLPDKIYLKKVYKAVFHKKLDLNNPQTFNEKLQWLKLYDRKPVYMDMVDKLKAKDFVSERIGKEYVIPTYAVWESVDDINFNILPDSFVLKLTQDSGSVILCENKKNFDISDAIKKIKEKYSRNYYKLWREWPYKNIKPKIIAEKYLKNENGGTLYDYKFFTFGGVPKIMYIAQGRGNPDGTVADFFDMDFNHLDLKMDHENSKIPPQQPANFDLMKELARKLSTGTPQLRVDFYEVNGQVYFGEMTFFHCAGFVPFKTCEWDRIIGDWIILPDKINNQ